MTRHAVYPPVIPVRFRRPLPTWVRTLRGLILALLLIGGMVLGTIWLMARIDAYSGALDSAFAMGMRAGQQMCGRGL